jgi:hypothetical protein
MSRNFLNRRSSPISDKRELIQDLVIPEFSGREFNLDSWGKEFESEINQKLFIAHETSNRKYEEFKNKKELNQATLRAVKTKISELEEEKTRFSVYDVALPMENRDIPEQVLEEYIQKEENIPKLCVATPEKILSIEDLPREVANESINEEDVKSSTEILDNSIPFDPPRPPVDLHKLMLQRERLGEELKETNMILRDLNIEGNVLKQDLVYFDQNLDQLSKISRQLFKDLYDKLNKLKLSGYANNFEIDAAKKLTMFFKMSLSDTPPNPDLLAKAVDDLLGNETNYFVMPDINTVLSKVQQAPSSVNKNPVGSRMNLKGSSSNLKGSMRNLKGSTIGLGDWSSNVQLTNGSFRDLLEQK